VFRPDRHHPDRYAMALLDVILGAACRAACFRKYVKSATCILGVLVILRVRRRRRAFHVRRTAPKRIDEALDVMSDEAKRIASEGLWIQELARASRICERRR